MSKYLLLTLSILMMPLAVRACDNDGPAQKSEQKAQQKELSERLAHSEYVVEKGKLARRPQGRQGTSTSLSHDDEFRVMEKGLDAAKSKLSIADGSAVIIAESGENYEVVIGNPPPAGTLGPDYTAKVLVDKKTLAISQILSGS
jgi:hypothetical protein